MYGLHQTRVLILSAYDPLPVLPRLRHLSVVYLSIQ
jgi:hypothetical protein